MAYQCLKCGSCFQEGTTTILRGCPDCHGMRFFYTDAPLTSREREARLKEAADAMPSLIEKITERARPTTLAVPQVPGKLEVPSAFTSSQGEGKMLPDGSLLVKIPKAIESRIKRAMTGWDYDVVPASPTATGSLAQALQASGPAPTSATPSIPLPMPASPAPTVEPSPEGAVPQPETVRIENPGQYEIDVRRLLEKSPIVIQKDGTYLIHLPSLFEMPRQPRT